MVAFDGSASLDSDPDSSVTARNIEEGHGAYGYFYADSRKEAVRFSLTIRDNAIAAYGWDWEADGVIDAFGRNTLTELAAHGGVVRSFMYERQVIAIP